MAEPLLTGERFLTHVSTDKPLYKPGETIYGRAAVLHALTRAPFSGPFLGLIFELRSPKGDVVFSGSAQVSEGVAAFSYVIPKEAAGGDYKLVAKYPGEQFAPATREISVRAFRPPRLKTELEFVKKAYGPGDTVVANLEVSRAEGGIPVGAAVSAVATLDGKEVYRADLSLDEKGTCQARFVLPADIGEGEGSLVMSIRDGGVQESAAKTLPIPRNKIEFRAYPEGGEWVRGLSTRLYVEAKTPKGKPADVAGRILDPSGAEVAHFATSHEGRGRVDVTPAVAGAGWTVKLDEPSGLRDLYPLPSVQEGGRVLRTLDDLCEAAKPVRVSVCSSRNEVVRVVLAQRNVEVASETVTLQANTPQEVALRPAKSAAGVLRVTLLAEETPIAERLVFRRPVGEVNVEIEGPSRSGLRAPISLTIKTRDQDGDPLSAVVSVAVVDDASQRLVEKREQPPRIVAQALLEPEVSELFDTRAYLDGSPDAPLRLDLLLGTQGWRRFAFYGVPAFLAQHKEAAERIFAVQRPAPPPPPPQMFFGAPGGAPVARGRAFVAGEMPRLEGAAMMVPAPPPAPAPMMAPAPAPMMAALAPDDGVSIDFLGAPEGAAAFQGADFDELAGGEMEDDEAPSDAAEIAMPAPEIPAPPMQAAAPMPAAPAPAAPMPAMAAPMPMPAMPAPGVMPKVAERKAMMDAMPMEEEAAPGFFARVGRALGIIPKPAAKPIPPPMPPMPPMPGAPLRQPAVFGAPAFFVAVREFAHRAPAPFAGERSLFPDTLYWNAAIKTDAQGEARISFDLGDAISSFEARADAFSLSGALGEGSRLIEARRPFYIEPKLPLEVTAGDQLLIPVAAVNDTEQSFAVEFSCSLQGPLRSEGNMPRLSLSPSGRARALLSFSVEAGQGAASVTLSAKTGILSDDVTRTIEVVPRGFPLEASFSGKLSKSLDHSFTLPDSVQAGSLVIEALVYPSPAASLEQAVAALLREPCGCFEQTSSSAYPNVMALQYLSSHHGSDPALVKRAQTLLEKGYERLLSYECKGRGYEWWGSDPGHEALTAYGLMEFFEMSQVYPVDQGMIERTKAWLLKRRDGKGGFLRHTLALDTFGRAPEDVTDAYIIWALGQTKAEGLGQEVAQIKSTAAKSQDAYLLALVANIALDFSEEDAAEWLARLAKKQQKDGSFCGDRVSVTSSSGHNLAIETTSLAILALLRAPEQLEACETAMRWLLAQCQGGRFGATQATILALKAIVAYDAQRSAQRAPGTLRLRLGAQVLGESAFDSARQAPIALVVPVGALSAGEHTLSLDMDGGSPMPYSLRVRYYAEVPNSAPDCKVSLQTALSASTVQEGETLDLLVSLDNRTQDGLPMVVAIVGLPGGLEARPDQLKEYVKEGKIDFYELRGREVILYRRGMAPGEAQRLTLSLLAAVPGAYTGPASRAYLYYSDDLKQWAAPLSVSVSA